METLSGKQRKHLRGLAHALDPVVHVGRGGITAALIASVEDALEVHELIKVKFGAFKEQRKQLAAEIAERCQAQTAGVVGNVAILYRPNPDPEKRRVALPGSDGGDL